MNMPEIKDEIALLRRFKTQSGFSNATIAAAMTAFGWTISESLVEVWLNGTKRPTTEQREYIRLFLLDYYFDYASFA